MRIYKEGITRDEVLNKQCCICGERIKNRVFHHIVPRRELKNNSGVVLCYQCHRGIHWIYRTSFKNVEQIYKKYLILRGKS